MNLYIFSHGFSSYLFSTIPHFYNIPSHIQFKLKLLSLCSSQYHILDLYRKNNYPNSILFKKIIECIDGIGIISVINTVLSYRLYTNHLNQMNTGIILFYISTKLTANSEVVKKLVYGIGFLKTVYDRPIAIVPMTVAGYGFYDYYKNDNWNHYNRTIWHLGNTIYVGMSTILNH
tara:strand:+ start:110 stop:634 length:525 start_codon:yes stop_codon:yes gene_type:complete